MPPAPRNLNPALPKSNRFREEPCEWSTPSWVMMRHIQNITWRTFFGGRICLGNFSSSSPHHVNYIISCPNRSPLDTPFVIHQNYLSWKPITSGLRTLWYPMVYFITNNHILLTSIKVPFGYHKDGRREGIERKEVGSSSQIKFLVVCIYISFLCILCCMFIFVTSLGVIS